MEEIKKEGNQFFIGVSAANALAKLSVVPTGKDILTIDHVNVSKTLKGQGVGGKLVNEVVKYARQNNMRIIPQCSFARKQFEKNPDYHDVLDGGIL